jgi:hypothetical protein
MSAFQGYFTNGKDKQVSLKLTCCPTALTLYSYVLVVVVVVVRSLVS